MSNQIEVRDLKVCYGGIQALRGVSFDVPQGKIVTLIGSNGAGKSTTLKALSGLVHPADGKIFYEGEDVTGLPPQKLVAHGIVLVPEGRRVFPNLTVYENLRIGAYLINNKSQIADELEHVYTLFPRLKERSWQLAGTLSGGEQQMLAVGRALMARPKVMMMDEPSLGLAPLIVRGIFDIIKKINEEGTTVLLIEQNANAALRVADRGYVMETGQIALEGTGAELAANPRVREAYLGKSK